MRTYLKYSLCHGAALAALLLGASSAEAKTRSNTQVKLPNNLHLADLDGDGNADLIQVTGTPGAGDANRLLVTKADFNATGVMHLYLDSDAMRVFSGRFMLPSESGSGADQVCTITGNGQLECYVSKDHKTLEPFLKQGNFIAYDEEIIVGDFDGNGADDLLLYRSSAGTFRMITRTDGTSVGTGFGNMARFAPGNLNGSLANLQFRAGELGQAAGRDDLVAYNPANGQVIRWDSATDSTGTRTFWWAFAANTSPPGANTEELSVGNLQDTAHDQLVLRNTSTGALRLFQAEWAGGSLAPAAGVAQGQLPIVGGNAQLVFAKLKSLGEPGGTRRDDTLFFSNASGTFARTEARYDASAGNFTYWWAFTQWTPTHHVTWPTVQHDRWLALKCKFSDHPSEVSPLFATDVYINNWLGTAGVGSGGHVDFYRQITYGKIDYSVAISPHWYQMTLPRTSMTGPAARSPAIDDCLKTAAAVDGIHASSYAGVGTLWNVVTDTGGVTVAPFNRWDVDADGTFMQFSAHENLHGYSLSHPHVDNPASTICKYNGTGAEYCDVWDPMGASEVFGTRISTYNLPAKNPGIAASVLPWGGAPNSIPDGIEINAPHRLELSAVPTNRITRISPTHGTHNATTFSLAALEKPEANGALVAKILYCDPGGAPCDENHFYTVELRQKAGWDVNIDRDTVLIHEVWTYGGSAHWETQLKTGTLASTPTNIKDALLEAEWLPGSTATYAATGVQIRVNSFDSVASTANITVSY